MTPPETTGSFFDLLGLDPDEPWDQPRFEVALKKKTSEWSRNKVQSAGKKKAEAEEGYRLLPQIKLELLDPVKREVHAERSRSERGKERAEKVREFEDRIKSFVRRGYLLEEEELAFIREYGPVFGETSVRQQCANLPKRKGQQTKGETPIDSSLAAEIARNLSRVGASTLYEFLLGDGRPVAKREPRAKLLAAAERIYRETTEQPNKTDEVTLRATVAGYGKTYFSSDELQRKYDATVEQEVFRSILTKADQAAGIAKALTAPQVQLLLEEASQNLDPEEARSRITAHARTRGWAIEVPSLDDQRWCGCGELNRAETPRCRACGQPLTFPCPGCGRDSRSEAAACTNCGFPIGRRFRVRDLIDEARALLDARSVGEARLRVAEAGAQWSAGGSDELTKALETLTARVATAVSEFEQSVQEVQRLVASRTFFAARARLLLLGPADRDDPQLTELRSQIAKAIAEAERQVTALSNNQICDDDAVVTCLRVLDACRDCTAAQQVLARHPPAPPDRLQAALRGAVVSLTWPRSVSAEVRYVVVRTSRVSVKSPTDGHRVATVDDTRCEDSVPEVGVDLHYAVYSERGGVTSRTAAHLGNPLIVLGEITGPVARVGDGEVRLEWVPPPNVQRVFAERTSFGTPNGQERQRLDSIDTRQLVDRSVVNDREYRYRLQCEFLRTTGEVVVSSGTDVVAMPQKQPATVEPFTVVPIDVASGRGLRLSWQSPPKGDVWVLTSTSPPACSDQAIPARDLSRHGETLVASGSSVVAPWQEGGVRYYTPVVVLRETAYVGSVHRYVHVEDVRDLQPQNLGDRVRLGWEWPSGCTEVQLSASGIGWPLDELGNLEPHATRTAVGRTEYDRHGYYDLRPSVDGDIYIVVQAVTRAGDENVLAPGARRRIRLCSRVELEYELLPRSLFRRSVELAISTNRAIELPPFRLVRKRGQLPQNREDGDCVLRQPGKTSINRRLRLPLAEPQSDGRAFGRLFLENDDDSEWITVLLPDRAKLKM